METTDDKETRRADAVRIYSIGHSDHSAQAFLDLLRRYGVTVLVDVRSHPYSKWVPQFNREKLPHALQAANIRYVFMGDSLGGRPADRSLYAPGEGHPDYNLVRGSAAFREGIRQLIGLAEAECAAMMCSEGDYHKCHRAMLITPALLEAGVQVLHIEPGGTTVEAEPEPKQLSLL
jgi:uncharacterized protein (DUF488 family)